MRIISGEYGGRFIKKVPTSSTRPTSDQVKETLFNMIGPYFRGGNVLDLYAGSGSLGIEAVSRGMDFAFLVDQNRKAIDTIQENITITKDEEKFTTLHMPAENALLFLQSENNRFNLVFLDPPYAEQQVERDIKEMIQRDLLDEISIVVCEVSKKTELPDAIEQISKWDEKKIGNKKIVIYQKNNTKEV